MKVLACAVIIALLGISQLAFSVNVESQSSVEEVSKDKDSQLNQLREELRTSSSVHQFLGLFVESAQAQDLDYAPLFKAIDALEKSLKNKIRTANNEFSQMKTSMQTEMDSINRNIKEMTSMALEAEKKKKQLQKDQRSFQADISQAKDELAANKKRRGMEIYTRKQETVKFVETMKSAKDAIDAIDQALQLMAQLRSPSGSQGALVEIKVETVKDLMKEVKDSTIKVPGFSMGALIESMLAVEMGQNFVDRESASRVVQLLNQLRSNLVNLQIQQQKDEEGAAKTHADTLKMIDASDKVANAKLDSSSSRHFDAVVGEKYQNMVIRMMNSWKDQYERYLLQLKKMLEDRSRENDELIKQIQADLDLIKRVREVLKANGIHRAWHKNN